MNRAIEKMQTDYTLRFLLTGILVAVAAGTAHLLWLGKVSEYMPALIMVLIICSVGGWHAIIDLWGRRKHLKQLEDRLENEQVHGDARLATEIESEDAARGEAGRSPLRNQKFSY